MPQLNSTDLKGDSYLNDNFDDDVCNYSQPSLIVKDSIDQRGNNINILKTLPTQSDEGVNN